MTEIVHGGALAAVPGEPVLPRWWRSVDRLSMAAVAALFAIGLLLALAASPPLADRNGLPPFHYVTRQAMFGAVALSAMLILSMLSPRAVRRLAGIGLLAGLVALALLPVFGTDYGKGAVRWYSLGFAALQPSEFVKPCFVVISAWLMAASTEIGGPPGKRMAFALLVLMVGLLAWQPDFGQATLITVAWLAMFFVLAVPLKMVFAIVATALTGAVLAYQNSEHFARRIDGFLAAEVDPTTQVGFAINAIRNGGIFGVGVGEGTVKWSLPDAHTDFIIAVAAEEYGLVLVFVIIGLYALVVLRSLLRLMRERDTFNRLAGAGLACVFGVQAAINLGVAVRLLPAKGMTLPLVSYGGSSLVATGVLLGMLLAFTRSRPQGEIEDIIMLRSG